MRRDFWNGRRVFLTGHTGFKGSWLALWLVDMGAEVHGYALPPEQEDGLYALTGVSESIASEVLADIRDSSQLQAALRACEPEIVLHLAAQPLVRASYRDPVETYSTNVMGLVALLEAVRAAPGVRAMVNVTTDKCYENREWVWPYRENEALGGHDPYSASKACAEIVTASYRQSFLSKLGIELASARAGNVIGGGDRASDRLVPDFLRALDANQTLILRNPSATRPWQHVLEPLSGYLMLAEALAEQGSPFAEAWNFGPEPVDVRSVGDVASFLADAADAPAWQLASGAEPHEAQSLALDSSKARSRLGWQSRWPIEEALRHTLDWHLAWKGGSDMAAFSLDQIRKFEAS
ncbi:CDP-glucose 4,6-dehydratase [Peteryoungia desertarenae]|uniref:CDP-glucose 4,6-dehydratase n=1 Tax=Peteryoungia desertarenae TaxID=1813451 RepID=UPI001FE4074A|nr:CDP-glucose 4,6-dehydratase [Peteryoungia desertarenae]